MKSQRHLCRSVAFVTDDGRSVTVTAPVVVTIQSQAGDGQDVMDYETARHAQEVQDVDGQLPLFPGPEETVVTSPATPA